MLQFGENSPISESNMIGLEEVYFVRRRRQNWSVKNKICISILFFEIDVCGPIHLSILSFFLLSSSFSSLILKTKSIAYCCRKLWLFKSLLWISIKNVFAPNGFSKKLRLVDGNFSLFQLSGKWIKNSHCFSPLQFSFKNTRQRNKFVYKYRTWFFRH